MIKQVASSVAGMSIMPWEAFRVLAAIFITKRRANSAKRTKSVNMFSPTMSLAFFCAGTRSGSD